jgi:hypothetical protein
MTQWANMLMIRQKGGLRKYALSAKEVSVLPQKSL